MTERQVLERLKQLKYKNSTTVVKNEKLEQEKINRKKRWITYFRQNPEIYISKKMGFHSFGYQNFSYHLMSKSNQYLEVSTRGTGKSLRAVVWACHRCLVFPHSKIGLTAAGASQADENYLTAFLQEIVYQYSPFMRWLWDNKLVTSKLTAKGYVVTFWNGSIIYFFPCINSSRGLHFDTLIGEELRLIKKNDWDSIAMPMLLARRAGYRNKPEYVDRIDLDENTKVIGITSNRFAKEWFNTMYRNTFINYFKKTFIENRVFSCDVFLALRHGLRKVSWFLQQRDEMNELDFRMEILNETIGEIEGAYFSWDMFRCNQVLGKAFLPPTIEQFHNGEFKKQPKKINEKRFIFADFAWAGDNGQNINDQTVIGCGSTILKNDKLFRRVEYMEIHSGSDANSIPLRVKELFWDYEADYLVMDLRSGGEIFYNQLTIPMEHPHRSNDEWNPHGLTICQESELQVATKAKLDDLRNRTVDPNAIPCIIPVMGSKEQNSHMWMDMKNRLKNNEISFLIDDLEFKTKFEQDKKWFTLTSEEKTRLSLPFIQTMLMINEAVNLKQEWNNGLLKLIEPRNGVKDRIVGVSYFNLIATLLETKMVKNLQDTEFNASEWQLLF